VQRHGSSTSSDPVTRSSVRHAGAGSRPCTPWSAPWARAQPPGARTGSRLPGWSSRAPRDVGKTPNLRRLLPADPRLRAVRRRRIARNTDQGCRQGRSLVRQGRKRGDRGPTGQLRGTR
jgi:hypothetical protein